MVEHTSSLPDAMPPLQQQQHQQMVEHTSLVTLLCGLARLGAKGGAGCSDDVGSSNKGSSSSEISSREYSSRSASKGSRTESRSSVDASKGSSSSVDSNDTDSSSSSTTTSANTRTGLQGSNCELQPAVMRLLHLCAVSALPRLSGGKLAVVAWAMAELQVCVFVSVCCTWLYVCVFFVTCCLCFCLLTEPSHVLPAARVKI